MGRSKTITVVVLLGAMLAGLAGAASVWAARRIVGGTAAAQGQFPFMAFVAFFNSSNNIVFICSGTLVSSNVVLTAGHCTVNAKTGAPYRAGGYRVVTGTVDWASSAHRTTSNVSHVKPDPNYDPQGPKHDAGLLVLSAPVTAPAVPLWQSGQINGGTPAQIAGWGETHVNSGPSKQLRWAHTVVQSASFCANSVPSNFGFDPSSQMCALDTPSDGAGECSGDSGGPLLAVQSGKVIEVGVTSIGPANCDTHRPDFYTAVRPIEPWVAAEIRAFAP